MVAFRLPSRTGKRWRDSAPLPAGLRIYAIGDIHGRLDLLEAMSAKIRSDLTAAPPEQSVEIYLGDYIDRRPQSRQVVDWLIGSKPACQRRICLRGNHEEMLLAALRDVGAMENWLFNGGAETLMSYGLDPSGIRDLESLRVAQAAISATLPQAHREFFAGLQLKTEFGGYLFVHAGIQPGRPIEEQDPHDLVWIREPFLSSRIDFGCVVVHGHSPAERPEIRRNRINIDTGAFLTGVLTCVVLEGSERRFLQATRP